MSEERDTESAAYLIRARGLHRDDVQRGEVHTLQGRLQSLDRRHSVLLRPLKAKDDARPALSIVDRVRTTASRCEGAVEPRRLDLDELTVARSIVLHTEEAGSELKPRRVSELTWYGVRGNRWKSAPVSTVCLYMFCAGRGNR